MLYLHEIIDIVGTGQEAYLKTVGERARHSERIGISRLMGSWKVIGSTHRWPRVVNLWEMDGWGHWADSLERQFLPEKKDRELAPWWAKATAWRSGGFDRILEPAAFSPTREELRRIGLRSWVCVQMTLKLAPGKRADYLDAVGHVLRPFLEKKGLTLLGAYSTPMHSDEALLIWAAPDFRSLCELYERRRENTLYRRWIEEVASLYREFESMWLVPSEHCFFHPLAAQKKKTVRTGAGRKR